jgi:hypothetical protein
MTVKIKFRCAIPEVLKSMPIKRCKPSDFNWFKKAIADLKNNKHLYTDPINNGHTGKCPGIISVLSTGWIHRAYQEFVIKTDGTGSSFEWRSEIDQKRLKYGFMFQDYVHFHTPEQLDKYRPMDKNTLKTVIKIHSPWSVVIPEGYSLLSTAVPFNDDTRFTAATGILKGTIPLNIQLFWHRTNSLEVVKKGTPLCYYLLIKDEQIEDELVEITDTEAVMTRYNMDNFNYPV